MRKVAAFLGVFVVIAIGLTVILHSIAGFFLGLTIVVCGPLGYTRATGRGRKPSNGLYWRGYVSFVEDNLTNRELFPDILRNKRSGGWGRKGLSSGKCEVRDTGIQWRSGGWATPQTEVSGTFDLPWSAVDVASVSRLSGKLPGLGGGITLTLSGDRGVVKGEFLGSMKGLSEALDASSRGSGTGRRHKRPAT